VNDFDYRQLQIIIRNISFNVTMTEFGFRFTPVVICATRQITYILKKKFKKIRMQKIRIDFTVGWNIVGFN